MFLNNKNLFRSAELRLDLWLDREWTENEEYMYWDVRGWLAVAVPSFFLINQAITK